MVEEADLRDFGEFGEAACEINVAFAWFEVAGGMVVRDHDGVCAPLERFFEHVAREGGRGVGCAARDANGRAERMQLYVKEQHIQLFFVVAWREDSFEDFIRRLGRVDQARAHFLRRHARPAASEFKGGGEFEAFDVSDAFDGLLGICRVVFGDAALQRPAVAAHELLHAPEGVDEPPRKRIDIHALGARLEDDRKERRVRHIRRIRRAVQQLARL